MAILHLLANPNAAASCRAALAEGDALLLLDDGVFALPAMADADVDLGVLEADAARLDVPVPDAVHRLGYADFVAWVANYHHSATWA